MVLPILDYSIVIVSTALIMTERMIGPRALAASERSPGKQSQSPLMRTIIRGDPPNILDEGHLFS
jgi:hypothetical protein